jgi:hypothetical protein
LPLCSSANNKKGGLDPLFQLENHCKGNIFFKTYQHIGINAFFTSFFFVGFPHIHYVGVYLHAGGVFFGVFAVDKPLAGWLYIALIACCHGGLWGSCY